MVAKGPFYVKILVTCCWFVLLKLICETFALLFIGLMLAGCSPSRMGVQAALPIVESQVLAIQEERDPELAKQAIPANLKILEGLLKQDPDNTWILENLAEGFCGYTPSSFWKIQNLNEPPLYMIGVRIMPYVRLLSGQAWKNGKTSL